MLLVDTAVLGRFPPPLGPPAPDGYILGMFRMPRAKGEPAAATSAQESRRPRQESRRLRLG